MRWHSLGASLVRVLVVSTLACAWPAMGQNPPAPAAAQQASGKAVLSGKVTDRAGKPVANATIQLAGQDFQQAKTDAQGNYNFRTIRAAGQYQIGVDAQGFLPIEYWNGRGAAMQLTPQSQTTRDLVLERGASIVVTVTDAAGEPIKGARVDASPIPRDNRGGGVRSAQADDTGMATVTVSPLKKQYMVCAVRDGFAPAHTTATVDSIENPVDVALAMEPGETVKGFAICSDGKPAAGWEIYATPEWWTSNYLPSMAKIDAKGNFTLKDLGPGAHKLNLHMRQANGGGNIKEIPVTINVPVAQQPLRVDLPVPSPASQTKVVGKVRVTGGRPDYISVVAIGASVTDDFHQAQVNLAGGPAKPGKDSVLDGSYTFDGLPAGTYQLQFQSPTTESKTLEQVKIPGEIPLVELKVVAKPHLLGTVMDAATSTPVAQFSIRVRKLQHLGSGPQYSQEARWVQVGNPEGKLDLELMSLGVYQVQVMADGYAATWSKEIRVDNAEVKTDAQIKLTAGGTLSGIIVDPSGKPVEGAKVSPFSIAGYASPSPIEHFQPDMGAVKTDASGRFTLSHLVGGDEKLRIAHPDFAPRTIANLKVADGQTADVGTIKLGVGGSAQGVVYDENGKPAAGASLEFRDQEGWYSQEEENAGRLAQVAADEEGKFRVEHLPEMVIYVVRENSGNGQGTMRRIIRPIEGKTTHVDLGGPNAISGTIIGPTGPAANGRIQLGGESPYMSMAVTGKTDAAGRFTLYGPPAGKYSLYFRTGMNRRDWIHVKDVEITGKPADLGELKAEGTDLLITVSSDDPATLESVQYVSIATDKSNIHQMAAQRDPATGLWRAKSVPAGTYRVSASTKLGTGFAVVVECDGKEKEKAVSLRLPKASATLSLSMARAAGLLSEETQIALIANDDFSVMTHASTQGEQPRIVKLPAGTYRVRDYRSRKVREEVPAITLGDGESKAVEISLPLQTGVKTAIVCVWSSGGVLVPDAAPRVVDADGKASELTGRWGLGGVYALAPGHYRAVLDRPGAEAITREFDVAGADKMINVDLFLPEQ